MYPMKKYIFKSWDKTSPSLKLKTVFSSLIHSPLYSISTTSLQVLLIFLLCHVIYFHHLSLPYSYFPLIKISVSCLIVLLYCLPSQITICAFSISYSLVQLFFCIKIISYSISINSQTLNTYSMGSVSILPWHSCPQS